MFTLCTFTTTIDGGVTSTDDHSSFITTQMKSGHKIQGKIHRVVTDKGASLLLVYYIIYIPFQYFIF